MLTDEEKKRYARQTILPEIGIGGQEKLKAAKVLVIGAGGLGCPVLQYLAAAGVGTIGIADGDTVDLSNLQRQVLYTAADVGMGKAITSARKIEQINPNIKVVVHPVTVDESNVLDLVQQYDIIVDGSDNFDTRYLVNDACVIKQRPMVSGAIYKFEGQVSVFNYNQGPTYRCLFPEPPGAGESPNCAEIGVTATLPGIIGTIQANEVIKMITGIGTVLSGKLLIIDTLTMASHTINFNSVAVNKQIAALKPAAATTTCKIEIGQLSFDEMMAHLNSETVVQLVDVREPEEHNISNIGGINIPLSRLDVEYTVLDPDRFTVVYCASGMRSNQSAKMLLSKGFTNVNNLVGGINHLYE
jgi:sulfur-carrier protein adenylyltransferase/sulfurtransferase